MPTATFRTTVRRAILNAAKRHPTSGPAVADTLQRAFGLPEAETFRIWAAAQAVIARQDEAVVEGLKSLRGRMPEPLIPAAGATPSWRII